MTPNEKRAEELIRMMETLPPFTPLTIALDLAERRGEERVLRLMRAAGYESDVREVQYMLKQARRARVGRGRK